MITDQTVDKAARAICDVWGYEWDGPDDDEQTAPEECIPYDERPSKALYREAARAALEAAAVEIGNAALEAAAAEYQDRRPDVAIAIRAMKSGVSS